jgi:hypothetical protein
MDKKILIALVALLSAAAVFIHNQPEQQDDYLQWKHKFGYTWTAEEDSFRRLIYLRNVEIIAKHNNDNTQTYKMGVNQFAGLTDAEFQMIYLTPRENSNKDNVDVTMAPINADIDWTTKGQVSPVKNQGSCGSCWAFSAVGVLESWALSKGQTVNLSEQQLVDCSSKYGNEGCNGGFNYQGLAYVKANGISTGAAYPYTAKTQTCKTQGGSFKISGVQTAKGCTNVQSAIQSRPIGVSADATNWSRYASGVFNNCGRNLNHDILLVGLTSSYYKIKNSWGTSWGEQGFIRLAVGNTCGICDDLSPWVQ